jgi:effector-binding domain-containing protein
VYVASTVINDSPDTIPDNEPFWWSFITQSTLKGHIPIGPPIEMWEENIHKDNTTSNQKEMMLAIVPPKDKQDEKIGWLDKIVQSFQPETRFKIRQSESFRAIILPIEGSLDQMPAVFDKLRNYMHVNGIEALGGPFTRNYNDQAVVGPLNLRWEAGYRINNNVTVKPPFKIIQIPGREILKFHFSKNFDLKNWNIQMASWLYHNDYRSVSPHHILWTHGIHEPGQPVPSFDLELEIRKFDEPYPSLDVNTMSMRGRFELILDMKGHHDQEPDAIAKIQEYVKNNQVEILGQPFVRYFNTPEWTPEEKLSGQVGIAVEKNQNVELPFRIQWKDGCELAYVTYEGDHMDIPLIFWHGFGLTFAMNGYKVNGTPMKVLRKKHAQKHYTIELQWPVNKW